MSWRRYRWGYKRKEYGKYASLPASICAQQLHTFIERSIVSHNEALTLVQPVSMDIATSYWTPHGLVPVAPERQTFGDEVVEAIERHQIVRLVVSYTRGSRYADFKTQLEIQDLTQFGGSINPATYGLDFAEIHEMLGGMEICQEVDRVECQLGVGYYWTWGDHSLRCRNLTLPYTTCASTGRPKFRSARKSICANITE